MAVRGLSALLLFLLASIPVSCLQISRPCLLSRSKRSSRTRLHNDIRPVLSSDAPNPAGPYNQAVWAGNTLYCSGQIALDPRTNMIVGGGMVVEEADQVLKNLNAVLQEAGLTSKNVVKTTVYLTNLDDFADVNAIYEIYFDEGVAPARSCVEVAALPLGALVEIDCIAVK